MDLVSPMATVAASAAPLDPWGAYVAQAATRFQIPTAWIGAVIQAESRGRLTLNGRPITSSAGAMGLMQLMPATWAQMRVRYHLGADPYDPHDNIIAGAGYLRQLYDRYGAPAFLAAYNAGPGRLDDYLLRDRRLPLETRRYIVSLRIGPAEASSRPVMPPMLSLFAVRYDRLIASPGLPSATGSGLFAPRNSPAPTGEATEARSSASPSDVQP